jgi:hypothetical protein
MQGLPEQKPLVRVKKELNSIKKVYYKDFYEGKKHWTIGIVTVKEESWLGGPPIKVVYVTRIGGGITVIPEWCLSSESRELIEKEC